MNQRNAYASKASAKVKPSAGLCVQPKLAVNAPGDRYEQEADAMADRVMCSPVQSNALRLDQAQSGSSIQRKCAACQEEEEKQPLMRKAEGSGGLEASPGLVSQLGTTKGNGSPLPAGTRNFMENAFSADFSRVRIHADGQAAAMSRGIQAKAFTHGSDIYFNSGQYSPHTQEGQRLLAHELTHTVQQGSSIYRSVGDSGGGTATGAGSTSPTGRSTQGRTSVDVLAAENPEDFLVRAAAQELGVDIRVRSMEDMISQLSTQVGGNGCLASLNIYNHGNPSIQMVAGNNKVKNADGTTTRAPMSGFSLNWLSMRANQDALNRLRHLFCCGGEMNWFGCSTVGVWAQGGSRTDAESASDAHRYTGTLAEFYQTIPEAIAHGALSTFRYIGAVNAQSWAEATCTTVTAATDFTSWSTQRGRVVRTTAHGGTRQRFQPGPAAACSCDTATGRVAGVAPSGIAISSRATEIRESLLRPYYEQSRRGIGQEPIPPAETEAQRQERERQEAERAAISRQMGQEIRTALLDRAGFAAGVAPANADEALRIAGLWGVDLPTLLSALPNLAAATTGIQSAPASSVSLQVRQRQLEAELEPGGRETFMQVLSIVQRERYWADYFNNHTIYIFPDISGSTHYRGFTQQGTRSLPDGRTLPAYVIHLSKDLLNSRNVSLSVALLIHELSHTYFEGLLRPAFRGMYAELANLIADHPQIAALRGSSTATGQRDGQVRRIEQVLYEASAYAEEEIFVHLQQLSSQPDMEINGHPVRGTDYILGTITGYLRQLRRVGLPPTIFRQVVSRIATQTRVLYGQRIAAIPVASERRQLELTRDLAIMILEMAIRESAAGPTR